MNSNIGISSIAIALPERALKLETLAELRGVDRDKYLKGLFCLEMALCATQSEVIELAVSAAKKAIERSEKSLDEIGMIAVGTESGLDMSRPLSSWIQEGLGLKGSLRSYEVKHACLGGTLALKQAVEWVASGAAKGKSALVIAADRALYAPKSSAEPTQGAGAIAMLVDAEAKIAKCALESFPFSESVHDFWRPTGSLYPIVDGPLSLAFYQKAMLECFKQIKDLPNEIENLKALCFHSPFVKMVMKSARHLSDFLEWDEEKFHAFYASKIAPHLTYNQKIGNAYTASLWISVASAFHVMDKSDRLAAFSYGSGCGAELLFFEKNSNKVDFGFQEDVIDFIAKKRYYLSLDAYLNYRGC